MANEISMANNDKHLHLEVFVAPTKDVDRRPFPTAPEGPLTWSPTTATLIFGEREAVLVDALMTIDETERLCDWIESKGRVLTTIYITHGHADHLFGAPIILKRFPHARLVALREVVDAIRPMIDPVAIARSSIPMFGDQIYQPQILPEILDSGTIYLEGHKLRAIYIGQSDTEISTVLHVPTLNAVVVGDIAYNDVHVLTASTDDNKRAAWIESIKKIAEMNPSIVVAGHKRPDALDMPNILEETIQYLQDYSRHFAESNTPEELMAAMLRDHPKRMNPTTLWRSVTSNFGQKMPQ
jgi:glyoxylase-like metal-dependent hydrolase (beta-lactamase superfamily II)